MDLQQAINIINENIDHEDVKRFLQPHLDRHFTRGLKTWQENNLAALVDEKINEREGAAETPEQIRIRELQAELDATNLKHEFSRYAMTKGIDNTIADILPADREKSLQIIDYLHTAIQSTRDQGQLEIDRMKADMSRPGGGAGKRFTRGDIDRMTPQQIADNINDPAFLAELK